MSKAFVIIHPEMGIYLGSAMGMGFWSIMDPVGQDCAVTFPSEKEAEKYMASWDGGRPDGASLAGVDPDEEYKSLAFASVDACVAAGLMGWSSETKPDPEIQVRLIGKPDEWATWNISQNLTNRWGEFNDHNAENKPLETLKKNKGYLEHMIAQMWNEETFIVRMEGRYGILFEVEYISIESEGQDGVDERAENGCDPMRRIRGVGCGWYAADERAENGCDPMKPHAEMIKIINDSTLEKLTPNYPGVEFAIPHEDQVVNGRPALWAFVPDGLLNVEQREALGQAMLNL